MRLTFPMVTLFASCSLALACSTAASNGGGGGGATADVQSSDLGTGDVAAEDDATVLADAVSADTIGADVNDAGKLDSSAGDTVSDSSKHKDVVSDTTIAPDAGKDGAFVGDVPDGGCLITAPDSGIDTTPQPFACQTDADCLGVSFPPCAPAKCETGSHKCKVLPAVDGTTCEAGGACGGPGVCKAGACNAPSTCKPGSCAPVEIKCGDSVIIDLATLSGSAFAGYGDCSSQKWSGPESAVVIMSDVSLVASLDMTTDAVTTDVEMFDIAPTTSGLCDAAACDDSSSYSLTLGVAANVPRIVMVDSMAKDTGKVTLTLECAPATFCGDGTCEASELCSTCLKDCGACAPSGSCGNGSCETGEDCASCTKDCGACDAGCVKNANGGCGGCGCEDCVCNGPDADAYCCDTSWDSICIGECAACGAKCPTQGFCGDGDCDFGTEDSKTCPNDCQDSYCGDGLCNAADSESCTDCSVDCGFCMTSAPASGCGDGKCGSGEDCMSCPGDCGKCGDLTCACEADSECCTNGFNYCSFTCSECVAPGSSCPEPTCGDGICAGESCKDCEEDCGVCAPYCGDGTCDSAETSSSCPADCAFGCAGKCAKVSKDSAGDTCWCDTYCFSNGDCCDDVKQFCCQ